MSAIGPQSVLLYLYDIQVLIPTRPPQYASKVIQSSRQIARHHRWSSAQECHNGWYDQVVACKAADVHVLQTLVDATVASNRCRPFAQTCR